MMNEPVWVAHPNKQESRLINIEPLLQGFSSFDAPTDSPLCAGPIQVLDRTIRTLGVTVHDPYVTDPSSLANLYRDLYQLVDVLGSLVEKVA